MVWTKSVIALTEIQPRCPNCLENYLSICSFFCQSLLQVSWWTQSKTSQSLCGVVTWRFSRIRQQDQHVTDLTTNACVYSSSKMSTETTVSEDARNVVPLSSSFVRLLVCRLPSQVWLSWPLHVSLPLSARPGEVKKSASDTEFVSDH